MGRKDADESARRLKDRIKDLVGTCQDMELLDLIWKLLADT